MQQHVSDRALNYMLVVYLNDANHDEFADELLRDESGLPELAKLIDERNEADTEEGFYEEFNKVVADLDPHAYEMIAKGMVGNAAVYLATFV